MDLEWFIEMLKIQGELARAYREQEKRKKLEKNRAEKKRQKENLAKIKSQQNIDDF